MNTIKNNKGFTLVEIMVALLITGIMMTLVMQFVFSQMTAYQREQKVSDAQQNIRVTMDEITRDLRMAGSGIPNVPIYTGWTGAWLTASNTTLPQGIVYPIVIVRGGHTGNNSSIFTATPSHPVTGKNDSLILIYQDPEKTRGSTTLTNPMTANNSPIVVPGTSVDTANGGTAPNGTGFSPNTPFVIYNSGETKADLFMVTATAASGTDIVLTVAAGGGNSATYNTVGNANLTTGHYANFSVASAADRVAGYGIGSKIVAVRVIRYDWSDDLYQGNDITMPITRLVNNDTNRSTIDSIGLYFGDQFRSGTGALAPDNINAMNIYWAPPSNASAAFSRGMPPNPYNIGVIRITLTAHTNIVANAAVAKTSSLFRVRTQTQEVQPRNYLNNM